MNCEGRCFASLAGLHLLVRYFSREGRFYQVSEYLTMDEKVEYNLRAPACPRCVKSEFEDTILSSFFDLEDLQALIGGQEPEFRERIMFAEGEEQKVEEEVKTGKTIHENQ